MPFEGSSEGRRQIINKKEQENQRAQVVLSTDSWANAELEIESEYQSRSVC